MKMWIVFLCLLTSAVPRASTQYGDYRVDLDAKVGETILIKTWSLNGTTLSIKVKRDNILNTTFFLADYESSQKVQNGRLMPKYNFTSMEASLIFSNVSREDEGLYQTEESFYRTKTEPDADYEEKDVRWNFQLNVIEPGEVVRGYVGENVSMEFSKPSKLSFLYRYDQKVSMLHESECLFLGTHFDSRLRCSSGESNTTLRIIIQSVTQRDAGLYKVMMDDTVRERMFLNITGTINTSTMNPVTLQGSFTKTQLHQVATDAHYNQWRPVSSSNTLKPSYTNTKTMNTVTLYASSTGTQLHPVSSRTHHSEASSVSTSSTVTTNVNTIDLERNLHEPVSIPDYVIPVIGVVGVIMLMIGFLIWIQRRNTNGLKTVERLILEKCETASFATPTTVRRAIPMPAREEGRTDRSLPQLKALHDAVLGLYCAANPRNAASVDTLYSSIYSLEKCVHDKPKLENILNCNQSSERSNKFSATCDEDTEVGILRECPSVCTLVSAAGREEHSSICILQRKVAKTIQALFVKVETEPRFSSKNYNDFTATGNADRLCGDEYEMAEVSSGIDPEEQFQNVEIASEVTKTPATSCPETIGTRKEIVHGTEEDHGYETFENIMKAISEKNVKVSEKGKSMPNKNEESKEEKMSSGIPSNDYADIDL